MEITILLEDDSFMKVIITLFWLLASCDNRCITCVCRSSQMDMVHCLMLFLVFLPFFSLVMVWVTWWSVKTNTNIEIVLWNQNLWLKNLKTNKKLLKNVLPKKSFVKLYVLILAECLIIIEVFWRWNQPFRKWLATAMLSFN